MSTSSTPASAPLHAPTTAASATAASTTAASTTAASTTVLAPGYPRSFLISAWSIPLLVIGQFAMLAIIPVTLVLVGTLRDARLRSLRRWAIALGVVYATPLAIWLIRPDGAKSLSRDMNPVFVVLISVAAAIVLIQTHRRKA